MQVVFVFLPITGLNTINVLTLCYIYKAFYEIHGREMVLLNIFPTRVLSSINTV